LLNNIKYLDKEKAALIPTDGKIFESKSAVIYEGESVFNVLCRELKKNKVHFEYTKTPMYNSAYIEGIGNLYEKDCGDLSGWTYRVNGQTPNCGCSLYKLKDGDIVEFVYFCDFETEENINNASNISYSSEYTECTDISCSLNELYDLIGE